MDYIPNQFKNNLSFWLDFLTQSSDLNLFFHYIRYNNILEKMNGKYNLFNMEQHDLINQLPIIIEKEQLEKSILNPLSKAKYKENITTDKFYFNQKN